MRVQILSGKVPFFPETKGFPDLHLRSARSRAKTPRTEDRAPCATSTTWMFLQPQQQEVSATRKVSLHLRSHGQNFRATLAVLLLGRPASLDAADRVSVDNREGAEVADGRIGTFLTVSVAIARTSKTFCLEADMPIGVVHFRPCGQDRWRPCSQA